MDIEWFDELGHPTLKGSLRFVGSVRSIMSHLISVSVPPGLYTQWTLFLTITSIITSIPIISFSLSLCVKPHKLFLSSQ